MENELPVDGVLPSTEDSRQLFERIRAGDAAAAEAAVRAIYSELRERASALMRDQRRDHTLQVTALVHEALLKLFQCDLARWPATKAELLMLGARAMKQVLTDHARSKARDKRKPPGERVYLDDLVEAFEERSRNLVALGDALDVLESRDPMAARLVHLRFFVGLPLPDVAKLLQISLRSAEREWRWAKAWLRKEVE